MTRIVFLFTCLLGLPHSARATSLEDVNQAYDFIYQHLSSSESLNEEKLQNSIDILEQGTQALTFDFENFAIILGAQLRAAEAINNAHKFNDRPFDVSQVQRLLDNLDDLKAAYQGNLSNLEFTAGHIAAHQLNDFSLAYRYWYQCAEFGHAGCMNILASSYESGEFIVQQDAEKAVKWHEKVVNTGTRWRCAGVLSAMRLAVLSHSHVDTGFTATYWLEKASEMQEIVAERLQMPEACGVQALYLAHYIMGDNDQSWRDKIAAQPIDPDNVTDSGRAQWLEAFFSTNSIQALMPALNAMYDDFNRCGSAEEFALKMKHDQAELQNILAYIQGRSTEQCSESVSTVRRLLNATHG